MFNAVKEYLEKGAEKWGADTERFIRQKLENACVVSIIYSWIYSIYFMKRPASSDNSIFICQRIIM